MSTQFKLETVTRVVFAVLLGALILFGLAILVLLIFVPVVTWYVWRLQDKNKDLERRMAALEGHPVQKDKQ